MAVIVAMAMAEAMAMDTTAATSDSATDSIAAVEWLLGASKDTSCSTPPGVGCSRPATPSCSRASWGAAEVASAADSCRRLGAKVVRATAR